MPRRVLLMVNRDKPDAEEASAVVRGLIDEHGELAGEVDSNDHELSPDDANGAELIVVLGGDGTLLGAARQSAPLGIPLLGVNVGKLGYLASHDLDSLRREAPGVFGDDELELRTVPLLEVVVRRGGRELPAGTALNECVVTAGPPFRVIRLGLVIDGFEAAEVDGDGLIVSTPLGTTAYNVSAGGPIVHPGADTLAITPIAAHSLSFRPIVVPGSSVVEIRLVTANEGDCCKAPGEHESGVEGGTTLVLDGQTLRPLCTGDTVRIATGARSAKFVVNPESNYWRTLATKMHWARPARRR